MQNEILTELARRTEKIERKRPSVLLSAAIEYQRKRGPSYSHRQWFGQCSKAETKAIQRAIQRLRIDKLIVTFVAGSTRITNLKLTDKGRTAASKL